MKKLLLSILIIFLLILQGCSQTQEIDSFDYSKSKLDCIHGQVNCEYPGNCGQYVDTNNNNICDHSE